MRRENLPAGRRRLSWAAVVSALVAAGDDNVQHQGRERLANKLIELGKPFDFMVYPNRTHGISEGAGTSLHVHSLIARYFLDHLTPGLKNAGATQYQ